MGEFSNGVLGLFSRAAAEQGGVISGDNPAAYNPSNPIRLWIIQLIIIIAMVQGLSLLLSRLRQPRVIAEVIGGVLLGPTVMGRIPGFKNAIFPDASLVPFGVTSSIGLILFLFLVGLEIDTRLLKRNVMASASVSVAGLVIPLGLGAALGVGVYREFINPAVNFGYFLLFVAVAIGITAFPVLCRILTELKLLDTEVGLVTLSAGIGNDVVGWVLLALTVALVNASSGLTALWVLLACCGYVIVLLYPGRWAMRWLAKRTGSLEQGTPTPLMMPVILLVVFVSAFFTDIIGVHAIFGGFLAGLVIPHDNGFAISITEKIEDLVSIVFLPLYFVQSGLKTNLGLLNRGKDWGYIIIICLVAFTSKFCSCATAAYLNGFNWRESGAIGSLMSCKGLVELIVLNIGLSAGLLDTKTFSMFVVHAIVLTCMTTPLVLLFYPAKYRVHHHVKPAGDEGGDATRARTSVDGVKTKFAVVLDKLESLPAAMTMAQLLHAPVSSASSTPSEKAAEAGVDAVSKLTSPAITIEALRLIELTNRSSAVMRSQEAESLIYNDPVVSIYRTFGQLNRFNVSANISVSQMVIVPWPRGVTSVLEEADASQRVGSRNPFDGIFHKTTTDDQTSSVVYSEYIRNVFQTSPSDVALFVDRGLVTAGAVDAKQHLFLPFFGGPDDRLALRLLVQICENKQIGATVVRIAKLEHDEKRATDENAGTLPYHNTVAAADTVYGQHSSETRLASDTADNLLWDQVSGPSSAKFNITFHTESSSTPLHHVIDLAKEEVAESAAVGGKTVIVITGRSRRMAVEALNGELKAIVAETGASLSSSVPKTLGNVGAALVAAGVGSSLLVVQTVNAVSNA